MIVVSSENWKIKPVALLRKRLSSYFRSYHQGTSVINTQLGITVLLSSKGRNKVSYGGIVYSKKACLVEVLKEIIQEATYSNYKERKSSDPKDVAGYINLNCKVIIDDQEEYVHLSVRILKTGKIYYNHEVNWWKK